MSSYNREVFISNLYYLVKQKGMKISDLENAANVSPGYISRIKKETNKTAPNVEFVANIANELEMSIDTLITHPLDSKTPTELLMIRFIDALIKQTTEDELVWDSKPASVLSTVTMNPKRGPIIHKISKAKSQKGNGEILSCEYQSPAHPGTTVYVKDDFYGTSIWSGEYVYLVKYQSARGDGLPHETGPVEFDLILWNKAIETTLLAHCDMQNHSTVFYDKIKELHNAILEANSHTHIPDEARFVIEKFVKGDLPF